MENDIMDESNDSNGSDDNEYSCPYRSPELREALLETPTAEGIQNRVGTIIDISGQFVEDVNEILDKCGSSNYVIMILSELAINLAIALEGNKQIITVDAIKEPTWNNMPDFKCVDTMHIFHTILLRELPPERIGGIINLILAIRHHATIEEIEESLSYLYGSGPYAEIANLPPMPSKHLTAHDINNAHVNEITMKKLKSMTGLAPKVIEDISEMFVKFPHDNVVSQALFSLVTDLVDSLHGDTAKIDANCVKAYVEVEDSDSFLINTLESILSTRLDEEVYCGLIKLMNAFSPDTSIDDIEVALEYLYGPKNDDP